ncbi:hypothetical protein BC835DRAFT_1525925 [Cytidiella melzeri]|nr:hypothetical protein BC835DRAFT_1525925 [Cytidiella melzeri]
MSLLKPSGSCRPSSRLTGTEQQAYLRPSRRPSRTVCSETRKTSKSSFLTDLCVVTPKGRDTLSHAEKIWAAQISEGFGQMACGFNTLRCEGCQMPSDAALLPFARLLNGEKEDIIRRQRTQLSLIAMAVEEAMGRVALKYHKKQPIVGGMSVNNHNFLSHSLPQDDH